MAYSPATTPRWKYALLAAIAFVYMITMLDLASSLVVSGALVNAGLANGGLTEAVIDQTYAVLQDNINAVSVASYLLFGVPIAVWVLAMRRNDRRRERTLQQARAAACSAPVVLTSSEEVGEAVSPAADEPADEDAIETGEVPCLTNAVVANESAVSDQPTVRFTVRGIDRRIYVAAVLIAYGLQFITNLIMVLVAALLPQVMDEYNTLVTNSGIESYGLMWIVSTLVMPPLVEETGFRGLGLTYLERAGMPFWLANVVQALAFGIFHMNLTQGLYTFVIGLVLGYLVHKSGSLVPGMLMHAVYNLMGTLGSDVIYAVFPDPGLFTVITCIAALIIARHLLHSNLGTGSN